MDKTKTKVAIVRFLSNSLYVIFNICLVIGIVIFINIFDSILLALMLVVLAKWRIFAVKIRYWWVNIKSAVVDYTVGFSFVLLMSLLQEISLYAQLIVAGLYAIWLIILKQKTSERFMMIQSLISILLFNIVICYFIDINYLLIGMLLEFVVSYFAVWHYLTNYDFDKKTKRLISGFWGMTLMEVMWMSYHWLIGYSIGYDIFKISQLSIVSMLLTYCLFLVLHYSYKEKNNKNKTHLMITPIFFSVLVVLVLILLASNK